MSSETCLTYAATNSSTVTQRDEFYDAFTTLVRTSKRTGIVMVAGYFTAQFENPQFVRILSRWTLRITQSDYR